MVQYDHLAMSNTSCFAYGKLYVLASQLFCSSKGFLHRGKIVVKNGVTLSFFNWIAKARGHWDFLQQMKISFEIALAHFSSRLISVISMINAICLVICIRFEPCEGNSRLAFNILSLQKTLILFGLELFDYFSSNFLDIKY